MAEALKLIVGLGNPGQDYSGTRHNAGFWFCERLAQMLDVRFASQSRFHGLEAKLRTPELKLLLPQTFMNRCGQSVRALAQFYRIPPLQMLIVHDELDIPAGQMRLKFGGGLGGHNGLKDITAHLGSQDFWRLRIGIGHPGDRNAVTSYVLKPPRKEEAEAIDQAIERALQAWPHLASGDFNAATRKINQRPASESVPPGDDDKEKQ